MDAGKLADETGRPRRPHRRRRPLVLLGASLLVVAVLALPLAFLLTEAAGAGASNVWHLIWRSLTASLLVEHGPPHRRRHRALCGDRDPRRLRRRADRPARAAHLGRARRRPLRHPRLRRELRLVLALDLGAGLRGAVLVMTLAVYPLVYLPVAASLRGADPGQEEIARSLGASRLSTFFRITLGQARRAILGGCLLVALVILAEYGAFEILGYQTFTTEIFTEFNVGFDTSPACAPLARARRARASSCSSARAPRRGGGTGEPYRARGPAGLARRRLGRARLPVLVAYGLLVLAALGVPIGSSIYWIFEGGAHALGGVSLGSAALYTAGYSALRLRSSRPRWRCPVALLVVRHPGRLHLMLERTTFLVLAMPGLVVALALSYFSKQYAERLRLPDRPAARPRLRDHVLPARPRVRAGLGRAVARRPGGGGRLARGGPAPGAVAG